MATKLPSLFLFLLLSGFQEMMMTPGEAAMCQTPSRLFSGLCFSRNNCESICVKEGFLLGECKMLKCICEKDCNSGGSAPGGGDPGQGPPDGNDGGSATGGGDPSQGPSGGVGGGHAPAGGETVQGPPHAGSPNQSPSSGKARPPENGPERCGSPGTGPPQESLIGGKTHLPEF